MSQTSSGSPSRANSICLPLSYAIGVPSGVAKGVAHPRQLQNGVDQSLGRPDGFLLEDLPGLFGLQLGLDDAAQKDGNLLVLRCGFLGREQSCFAASESPDLQGHTPLGYFVDLPFSEVGGRHDLIERAHGQLGLGAGHSEPPSSYCWAMVVRLTLPSTAIEPVQVTAESRSVGGE